MPRREQPCWTERLAWSDRMHSARFHVSLRHASPAAEPPRPVEGERATVPPRQRPGEGDGATARKNNCLPRVS